MELVLWVSAAKRAGAASVTCIVPYYGYARQDRKGHKNEPITASDVSFILEQVGVNRILSVDVHCS